MKAVVCTRFSEDLSGLQYMDWEPPTIKAGMVRVKLFGGGDMFPTLNKTGKSAIGQQNVTAGLGILALHGQPVKASHVGGEGHRIVMFDLWDGSVWVKHQPKTEPAR